MRRPLILAAAALLAGICVAAIASPASAAPAWWRVSDGHGEVWVLGAPQITPKAAFWDTSVVERRLAGANRLIVAAQPKGGIAAMAGLLGSGASPTPMEASLPPPLRKRFDAVATGIGKNPKAYDRWKPAIAGVMLAGDVYKSADLKQGEVEALVRKMAKKAGVAEAPAGSFDVGVMASAAGALPPAGQPPALAHPGTDWRSASARLKADAAEWARGDPRPEPPGPDNLACVAAMPGMKTLTDRNMAAASAAIAAALKAPGRTLAVFDIQQLTMPGGLIERLRPDGAGTGAVGPGQVSGPLP